MGDGISQETGSEDIRKRMSFYLGEVGGGHKTSRSLSLREAEDAFRSIFEGNSSEAQTAAFLIALRIKGSSDEERLGLLNILREYNEEAGFNFPDLTLHEEGKDLKRTTIFTEEYLYKEIKDISNEENRVAISNSRRKKRA